MRHGILASSAFWLGSLSFPSLAQVCVPELNLIRVGDTQVTDAFGVALAVDGDTAVIGAPFHDELGANAGAAYVFVFNGTDWVQQAKLLALNGSSGNEFGRSVAMDGDTVVVGAPGGTTDRAYVFVRQGSTWSQQDELRPPPGAVHLPLRSFGERAWRHDRGRGSDQ